MFKQLIVRDPNRVSDLHLNKNKKIKNKKFTGEALSQSFIIILAPLA
jgi:hypothetical protein